MKLLREYIRCLLVESDKAAEIRDYYGIDLWMKGPYGGDQYEPDIVEIESLVVPEEKRGQGIATDVMFELVRWADSNGYILALDPSSDFGSSVSRLRKFYSQFGFSGNKGRKKDYRTRYAMIRYPKNKVLKEQVQGSKGSLVVVDIQPEYESGTPFDIGDMLRTAAGSYSRVLFLYNGPELGMIDESGLKNFYFEKLDYDEEVIDELLSKSEFFDKGYGFFRDVMDSDLCFDRSSVIKIVKYMIDNDYRDIRELEEEDVEAIGVSELLFDDLEDYGFYIPDLEDILPSWNGSDIAGGARNECLAEVEILGAAQGLSFNQVGQFIYEGDNRYTEALLEVNTPCGKNIHSKIAIPPPPSLDKRLQELELISYQYNNRYNPDDIQGMLDNDMLEMYDALLRIFSKGSYMQYINRLKQEVKPVIRFYKQVFNSPRPYELAAKHNIPFKSDYLESAQTPSYPSGHTTQAFYIAIKLSRIFPDLKEHLFAIANMVAESRIDRGVHFPSDNEAGKMLASILAK